MKIFEKKGLYVGLRDTGDSQRYLGLKFGTKADDQLLIRRFCPTPLGGVSNIDERLLINAVKAGINKYNLDNGTNFSVTEIEYVPYESPNYEAYTVMSEAIIRKTKTY